MSLQIEVALFCPAPGCIERPLVSTIVTSRSSIVHEVCEKCDTPLSPRALRYGKIEILFDRCTQFAFTRQGESSILSVVLESMAHARQVFSQFGIILQHQKTLYVHQGASVIKQELTTRRKHPRHGVLRCRDRQCYAVPTFVALSRASDLFVPCPGCQMPLKLAEISSRHAVIWISSNIYHVEDTCMDVELATRSAVQDLGVLADALPILLRQR
jgi:hypothetical protein